jgi:hypothetical protein
MRLALDWTAAPSGATPTVYKEWRVEDVINVVAETLGVSGIDTTATVRIHQTQVYGLLDSASDPLAVVFNARWMDPVEQAAYKTVAAFGDIDDPPRVGVKYPSKVREALIGWDGVSATSPSFVQLKTTSKAAVVTYVDCVITLSQAWTITQNPQTALTRKNRDKQPDDDWEHFEPPREPPRRA